MPARETHPRLGGRKHGTKCRFDRISGHDVLPVLGGGHKRQQLSRSLARHSVAFGYFAS